MVGFENHIGQITISENYLTELVKHAVSDCFGVADVSNVSTFRSAVSALTAGKAFKKKEDLFEEIFSIMEGIPSEIKYNVFEEWAERCQWVFSYEGLYFPN